MDRIFEQTFRRALEETREAFSAENKITDPAMAIARLSDVTRSNSFLWVETWLRLQEHFSRTARVGLAWARILVLMTLAADIYTGYISLRERARWWPNLVTEQDWQLQHQRSANRILDTAASLGGALIKACQFASTRPDLLPAAYIHTLAPLQDHIPPHAWSTIEAAITRELGRNPREVFGEIDSEPIAAASIAQVHRARLGDGHEIALKVQYPEIATLVDADLKAMEIIFKEIARVEPDVQLQPILDYLKGTLPLELDFRREAAAMTELQAALRHRADVLVPTAFPELCTERLLAMEFIDGIKITDRTALLNAGISLPAVARLLNDLYAEQMLRLGVLHADPHPGNLLVQPGPKLVLLDHGLTVRLAPSLVHALTEIVRTLVALDFDGLTKALAEAGLQLDEQVDITSLMQLVGVLLGEEPTSSAVDVGVRLSRSVGHIPVDLLMVGRALGLLDGITKQLDPDLDTLQIVAGYCAPTQ